MKNKQRKLKLTAEDITQKVLIDVKMCHEEDEAPTMEDFYYSCEQLAYAMGYSKKAIKKYFTTE